MERGREAGDLFGLSDIGGLFTNIWDGAFCFGGTKGYLYEGHGFLPTALLFVALIWGRRRLQAGAPVCLLGLFSYPGKKLRRGFWGTYTFFEDETCGAVDLW